MLGRPMSRAALSSTSERLSILGMQVAPTSYAQAAAWCCKWSQRDAAGYICAANVHMCMECWDSGEFRAVVNGAALVTPDGMPLVWALRLLGCVQAQRVYGPTLMLEVCAEAERRGIPIGLHGGTTGALVGIQTALVGRFPALRIVYAVSPPFSVPTAQEDADTVARINASGCRLLFVGLGCPKQERWMAAHQGRVAPLMLGVGAAFAFHAGQVAQAPALVQRIGMEWAFRLAMEPRRLWKRYALHNPRFVLLFALQLLGVLPRPRWAARTKAT